MMTQSRSADTGCLLNLDAAPSTLLLFGLAGSGKSFVGDMIARQCQWHIYHADDDLTDKMKSALKRQQPFTEPMRDEFFAIITQKILHLQAVYDRLVVTQAVYKQRHREQLLSAIPNMEMIMIDAADSIILPRLQRRSEGVSQHSAAALRRDFEYPDDRIKVIVNDGDRLHIVRQLNAFYNKKTTSE